MTIDTDGEIVRTALTDAAHPTTFVYTEALTALDRLLAENGRLRARQRVEDAMLADGIAALETLYENGRRRTWISRGLYNAIERAVLALREAATSTIRTCR